MGANNGRSTILLWNKGPWEVVDGGSAQIGGGAHVQKVDVRMIHIREL